MITIIKGNEKIVCTKGTFEEQYKSLGYQIASENKGAAQNVAPIVKEETKVLKDLKENQKKEETKINEKYKLNKKKERK